MRRRWLVRVAVLLMLMIVAAIWIVSSFGDFGCGKAVRGQEWYVGAIRGHCYFGVNYLHDNRSGPLEFDSHWGLTFNNTALPRTTLGFGYHRGIDFLGRDRLAIVIPLWAPTLLLVALNWFIWRITRPPPALSAFPVEPVVAKSPSTSKTAGN